MYWDENFNLVLKGDIPMNYKTNFSSLSDDISLESPNTDMLLRDLLLITHNYTQSNSKTS